MKRAFSSTGNNELYEVGIRRDPEITHPSEIEHFKGMYIRLVGFSKCAIVQSRGVGVEIYCVALQHSMVARNLASQFLGCP